jgi:hypothetical protein
MIEEREQALDFFRSMRGQLIIGQALAVAVDTMDKVEPPAMRERSNIADMQFLLDNLFTMGLIFQEQLAKETH